MIRAHPRPIRVAVAILAVASCLYLIQASARIGFSRLLSRFALTSPTTVEAEAAVGLSPSDPEARRVLAIVLARHHYPIESVQALESATSLRPRDDNLWLELGNAREGLGDTAGALAAFDQAVRWAPYYGYTHWQRGNFLLRIGRYDDAFAELRTAASRDPRYFPNLIDLAWGVSRGDLKIAEQWIQINNDEQRRTFINYLFSAKAFRSAFALWSTSPQTPALFNGGFEDQLVLTEPGFGGWVSSTDRSKNRLAIDASEKIEGTKSLQITLAGEWTPGTPLLSQTVVVEPSTRYRIYFSVRTKDLVTGGPPVFTVSDASTNEQLGKSQNFPSATTDWTRLSFEFTTPANSEAAVIQLQRNNCDPAPCPIFGVLWLDEISIGK
ncbi:MAG TPA: carbohydrate binding domain-containing protein [Pyrinomonadaceae bacterium]|nr:carbohydrate binding domain-containing protein [Pyrinomonadaceae bacterium]